RVTGFCSRDRVPGTRRLPARPPERRDRRGAGMNSIRGVLLLALAAAANGQNLAAQDALASAQSNAQTNQRGLTIQEAEAVALKNNPQITVGKLRALEAHEFVREVRATLMPQANGFLEGVGADSGTRLSAGGFLTNGAMFSRAAAGVAVSQLI